MTSRMYSAGLSLGPHWSSEREPKYLIKVSELWPMSPKYTVCPPCFCVETVSLVSTGEKGRSAHLLEKKQTIEDLEELGARLMDGSENSLSVIGELPEKLHDGPGGLRVESRRLRGEGRS